jgi:hypothetical protein
MTDKIVNKRSDRRRRQRLDKRHVLGLPQLRFVEGLLDSLRSAYDHPNRKLYFDDLFIALLLAFYNPVVRSLRGVEDASQMPGINQHLDIAAIKRSTAGDAMSAFDPQLLVPLIADLRQQVSPRQMDETDETLRGLLNRLLAFDGSYFRTACDVGWALRERHGRRKVLRSRVRLNLHFSVRDGVPTGTSGGVSIAGDGDASEAMALLDDVQAGQIVVADRGCFSHETVHRLLGREVDFVLRLQSGVKCEVPPGVAERPLTQEDRDAGIISDQTVLLTGCKNPHEPTPLRLVTIQPKADSTRDGAATGNTPEHSGQLPGAPIRLLTSVRDQSVAAWMIGHLYRRRWDIELFFRWLKTCAKWEHLLSESRGGMLMQFYVALIGTLLLAVVTGRQPDRYSFNLMCLAAGGYGSVDDALAIYQRRCAERDRDRERRRQRLAQKKSA